VEESYLKTLGQVIREAMFQCVGFESAYMTHQQLNGLFEHVEPNIRFVPTSDMVESLRMVKEPEEIELLRRAIRLTSDVFEAFVSEIKPGVRECDLAAELEYRLRRRGAEKMSFETILASGERSALPHGIASDKRIGEGFVVCDFGIVLDGYCSDMTRTVYVGTPDDRARHLYETVREAQIHCEENMRAGMDCKSIDALTRDVITAAGFGDQYGHSTGHGIGLEVHEAPRLAKTADGPVPAGAVVTVEPGIYVPEWGGVRIEDMVVMTETGCDILTPASKELMVL
jgi:Xaa-Pro aminopeptidase